MVSRSEGIFDASYMSMRQLDDTLVLLGVDGQPVLVDPGEKLCPFGTVNWRHSNAGGVRQSAQGAGYAQTPEQSYAANVIKREGTLDLDAHGQISGVIRVTTSGQESLRWRQRSLEIDETELKKEYDKTLENITPDGVEAHVDHFMLEA